MHTTVPALPVTGEGTAETERFPPPIPDHQLLRPIGAGSYGEVWLARCALGRYRAVKIVRRASFAEQHPFDREFEGIRRFEPLSRQHESQVDILHVGRADGCFYYVMELADPLDRAERGTDPGGDVPPGVEVATYAPRTLKTEISRRAPLPMTECLDLALALTASLQFLHDHGLVHRDVKPSNIIFIGGVPKLADLGLVAEADATRSFVGTEGYIPPEGPGTPQADLFSLGKVLYELSTGKRREEFPELPEAWSRKEDRLAWPEFFEVVLKACDPDPRRRYQTARELRADLVLLEGGKSLRQVRSLERRLCWARRFGVAAGGLLALVALGHLLVLQERRQILREARRADLEAARARAAEALSRDRLRESYLAQAQARRWSGRVGRRFLSLAALEQAAAIRPGPDLRDEAIACLALADARVLAAQARLADGTVFGNFDARYERYLRAETNGDLTVLRVGDDQELVRWSGFARPYRGLGFSPDGSNVVVAWGQNPSRTEIRRLNGGEPVLQLAGESFRAWDFSADSRRVAMAFESAGFPIRVYDLATKTCLQSFAHGRLPYQIRLHPTHPDWLLISDQTPTVGLWDCRDARRLAEFPHSTPVMGLAWHPRGEWFAAGGADHRVWLWPIGQPRSPVCLPGHQGVVVSVSFSPEGEFLASRGWDGTLRLWEFARRREMLCWQVKGFNYDFSRTGCKLGCSLAPGSVDVLEVVPGSAYQDWRLPGEEGRGAYACGFSPDGRLLVASYEGQVRLWDVAHGRPLGSLPDPGPNGFAWFHPDGRQLFSTSPTGLVVWSVNSAHRDGGVGLAGPKPVAPRAHFNRRGLSADGSSLAFETEGLVHLLELATGRQRGQFRPEGGVAGVALSANGRWAAVWAPTERAVEVWDTVRTNRLRVLVTRPGVRPLFSPDDQWLVTGDWDDYRLWRVGTWTEQFVLPRQVAGHKGFMAFSPDSRILAVALSRYAVRLVEVPTGRELATLEAPDPLDVSWLAFSPDGTRLAVATTPGAIQVWDVRALRLELRKLGLDWDRTHLYWSPTHCATGVRALFAGHLAQPILPFGACPSAKFLFGGPVRMNRPCCARWKSGGWSGPKTSSGATKCWSSTIICIAPSWWGSTCATRWSGRVAGWPWRPGAPRRCISKRGTPLSAGPRRNDGNACRWWSTTPASMWGPTVITPIW